MNGGGRSGGKKMGRGPPLPTRLKERDEDLLLFRDMHKSEKDRNVSLLQPVSDEFEPTGTIYIYIYYNITILILIALLI